MSKPRLAPITLQLVQIGGHLYRVDINPIAHETFLVRVTDE